MPISRIRRDGLSKGEQTRRRIVERAAVLFNSRGVAGASMSDITEATGLEKGGVYNHFASKDELAREAFDFASGLVIARLEKAVDGLRTPLARLRAMIEVFRKLPDSPYLAGGCPLLNMAVESDDTNVPMRNRVRDVMTLWRKRLTTEIDGAVAAGELRPVDAFAFATTAVAALEGAIMLSQLYRDGTNINAIVDHLQTWIDERALPAEAVR
jgi:AcrR family transcriptional regulator